jgi:hypothetical protein
LRKVLVQSLLLRTTLLASKQQATVQGNFEEKMQPENIHKCSSKLSSNSAKGEAVEGKERFCKVCAAKFPRDRRLRLSANTAIQFYDVQDRLGYERPSDAIDWLLEKAKAAIEALASSPTQNRDATEKDFGKYSLNFQHQNFGYDYQINQHHMNNSLSFISEDSLSTTPSSSNSMQFQGYPPEIKQDLCLSFQSLQQDPILGATPINFAEHAVSLATDLSDFNATEIGWFQMMSRNADMGHEEEEFVFNAFPQSPQPAAVCQNQHNTSNGPSCNICSPFHY